MQRQGKLLIIFVPLAGFLMASMAIILSARTGIPLPYATWFVLFSCACITVANWYLIRAIETAREDARQRGEDHNRIAVGKGCLLAGLVISAAVIEFMYIENTSETPYSDITAGILLMGFSAYGLVFALTKHDDIWEGYRQVASGNSSLGSNPNPLLLLPLRWLYESYHYKPTRVFYGICSALGILIGVWALWR